MEKITFLVIMMQMFLFYSMVRTPRTCWHGWKISTWLKLNSESLDNHALLQMGAMWRICKIAAWTMGGMFLTFFMNMAFGSYVRFLISNDIETIDPTLIALFALTNAGCIVYGIQAHKDDTLIKQVWEHYDKRHNAPWPPKII